VEFRFRAGETVGIGDLAQRSDPAAVATAAHLGGAAAVIDALPERYRTQLGQDLPGGVDLSTGQWQKLAISRGMMRAGPLLTILDEPTAALDPRAEHELFERFARTVAAGGGRHAVTLLVSHRFSTVQMADLIVVLDGGRVLETGTHRSLMAAGGHYAELYGLQASRYD
jgi:ATP-binding cassette subfamily B protein